MYRRLTNKKHEWDLWITLNHKSIYYRGTHVSWGEWVFQLEWNWLECLITVTAAKCAKKKKDNQTKRWGTSHLFSTLTNNTCHPPPYLHIYIYLVHLYLISILLIKWKTTELPVGYCSAHVCVSVIYCSGFDSECFTHPKPMLISLTQLLQLFIHIRHNNLMYVKQI